MELLAGDHLEHVDACATVHVWNGGAAMRPMRQRRAGCMLVAHGRGGALAHSPDGGTRTWHSVMASMALR